MYVYVTLCIKIICTYVYNKYLCITRNMCIIIQGMCNKKYRKKEHRYE